MACMLQLTFQDIIDIVEDNEIDLVIIAGDVYDRAIASKESIVALNHFFLNHIIHHLI